MTENSLISKFKQTKNSNKKVFSIIKLKQNKKHKH